jgi:hypothetical protein
MFTICEKGTADRTSTKIGPPRHKFYSLFTRNNNTLIWVRHVALKVSIRCERNKDHHFSKIGMFLRTNNCSDENNKADKGSRTSQRQKWSSKVWVISKPLELKPYLEVVLRESLLVIVKRTGQLVYLSNLKIENKQMAQRTPTYKIVGLLIFFLSFFNSSLRVRSVYI